MAALSLTGFAGVPARAEPAVVNAAQPADVTVRAFDFNVCGGYIDVCRPTEHADDWAKKVARKVTEWNSDVATFQEMCDGQRLRLLAQLPGYQAQWYPSRTKHYGCEKWLSAEVRGSQDIGIAVFVKTTGPVTRNVQELPMLWDKFRTEEKDQAGKSALLCAGAAVKGRDILACTAHLNKTIVDHGVPEIATRLRAWAAGRPVIFAGDLNADPFDALLDPLYAGRSRAAGEFREVDEEDSAFFTAGCRHVTRCRTGEPTTFGDVPRKFDYMFGTADRVRWTGGGPVDPGLQRKDHRILRGEAVLTTDTTAPAAPVVDLSPEGREAAAHRWIGAVDVVAGRFTAERGQDHPDPIDDLIVRWWNGAVDLYPGRADGTLGRPAVVRTAQDGGWNDAADIAAGDFDGDGWDDIAVRWSRNSLFVYDGKSGFRERHAVLPVWALNGVSEIAAGDVDGDPEVDRDSVVIRREDGSLAAFAISDGKAAPMKELLPAESLSDAQHIAFGDAYGSEPRAGADGHDDMFVRWNAGSLYVFPGPASAFSLSTSRSIHPAFPDGENSVATTTLGDFDGDGRDEIVVRARAEQAGGRRVGDDGRLRRYTIDKGTATEAPRALAPVTDGWSDVSHAVIGSFTTAGASEELRRWSSGSITPLKARAADGTMRGMSWPGVRDLAPANLVGDKRDDLVVRQGVGRIAVVAAPFDESALRAEPGVPLAAPAGGWCPGSAITEVTAGDALPGDRDDLVLRCGDGAVLAYPVTEKLIVGAPVRVTSTDTATTAGLHVDRIDGKRAVVLRTFLGAATAAVEDDRGGFAAQAALYPAGTWADARDVYRDDATGTRYVVRTSGAVGRYPVTASTVGATLTVRAADDVDVDHFRYAIDGSPTAADAPWADLRYGIAEISLDGLSPGAHTIRVVAVDRAGNSSAETSLPVSAP
ncbi:FG-GAP-like repeat-containing protein [Actinoplanes sp. NPDC051859]|uniref:FG-GAP-like repeat-containing protein n=1 Tax=Actinoplanes sp. NPDC051859 TaxID=3363909 RepID=UPI003799F666